MLLSVLRHIEANQLDAEFLCKHLGDFCFTYTSRTHEQQWSQWFVVFQQSRFRHLHTLYDIANCLILTVYLSRYTLIQWLQRLIRIISQCFSLDFACLLKHFVNHLLSDSATSATFILTSFYLQDSSSFIYQVDCLVWQTTLQDMLSRWLYSIINDSSTILNMMELLIRRT